MSGLSVGQLLNRLQELSGNVVFGESSFNFFFFFSTLIYMYQKQCAMKLFSAPVDWLQVEFSALLIAHKVEWKLPLKC